MVVFKKSTCLSCVRFRQTKAERIVFYILDKKEFFLEQKREVSKLRKNCNFQRGISPWFLSRKRALPWVLFGQIMPQKIVFGYSRYKRTPFRPVKRSFERVEKIEIF